MKTTLLPSAVKSELKHQLDIISRGAVDLLPEDELQEKLVKSIRGERGPLRIKQGFDPTSPDIHVGHTVGLRKLKQFQELGHQIVLVVGDYTAMVGDPSGRSDTRPQLSHEEIMRNAETYQAQFFRVLDKSKTEVVYNGDWFKTMSFADVMHLAARYTVARLLERDDFAKRIKAATPISIHELLYPLMQGYDSVEINADLELGGTEQKFNLLVGRTIQAAYGKEPQCILTMPILVGTDGVKKMSKSLCNYIGITESHREMFGKVMSIPDTLICDYFELTTDVSPERLETVHQQLSQLGVNPKVIKQELGRTLVDMYHPDGSGEAACEEFERMFSQKQLPDEMAEIGPEGLRELGIDPASVYLVHLIVRTKLTRSSSEARRLIGAGSVSLDGQKVVDADYEFPLDREIILKVGKRRFLRLKAG